MHIPPYVWIHIKNFMLQGYWRKKYTETIQTLPLPKKDVWPHAVVTSATKPVIFRKEFERSPFHERISTVYSILNR